MKTELKLQGQLKRYARWPLVFIAFLLVMNGAVYVVDIKAGILCSAFAFIYIIFAFFIFFQNRPAIVTELVTFAAQYGQIQKQILLDLEVPYALLDETGKIIWTNSAFDNLLSGQKGKGKPIGTLIPAFHQNKMPKEEEAFAFDFSFQGRDYKAKMKKVSMREAIENNAIVQGEEDGGYMTALYLFDETEEKKHIRENEEQHIVIGLIYIDNYEEAMESVEEVRRSLLTALIDRKINKYISAHDGIVKKMEKDKFLLILDNKSLRKIEENRIELLEDVKTVNIGNKMAVSLSMGIGVNAQTKIQAYDYARTAIDLALGRGGDQAVIKSPEQILYYGGRGKQVEKNTRVKSRVKAHALREILENKDRIMVMGHKIVDVDSFGAAIGIMIMARSFRKKVHIVINDITTSVRPLIDGFINSSEYDSDLFIKNHEALELMDQNTALIIVDVNKPSYTECKELLTRAKCIVVLDHHRQGTEAIENATLSYIETYASSTCEMVAEILQYINDNVKIRPMEADCIYSGIIIDTNNFLSKIGVRTFEAAAFLRRNGADVVRVRKMFRDEMVDYKARAETVRHAEVYKDVFAISVCPSSGVESPTVVGAQAANELLNINGMKASFVMTNYQGKIFISARSIDEINVQLIMEKLGGGGHMNIAGAQLEDCTISEAKQLIRNTLDSMLKKGEI